MSHSHFTDEIKKRRTFAIISHPDAGKTTITEKMLLWGKVLQKAGTIKRKGNDKHVTSDWMAMERDRGISITSSVMSFWYRERRVNLLDTPGHQDFSEDTYRTLTAVDSALMVIDNAKGVEERTIKLMQVCRMRQTPVITFINKIDREGKDAFTLLEEIEEVLGMVCMPINWPLGMGQRLKGIYDFRTDKSFIFQKGLGSVLSSPEVIEGLDHIQLKDLLAGDYEEICDEIEMVKQMLPPFDSELYLEGLATPVFFGTALGNFGVENFLNFFVDYAPKPQEGQTATRLVQAEEEAFSGFIFKVQANMDAKHRDRIAFLRIASGSFQKGMKLLHVRTKKVVRISEAVRLTAGVREPIDEAYAGDIIGIVNHGTIQIGDTFTSGESLFFIGVPYFAPEIFRKVILQDPLKMKQLRKGLQQLSEEGAVQVFYPYESNEIILGALGMLQYDTVAYRLLEEYGVQCRYEHSDIYTIRWVGSDNSVELEKFSRQVRSKLGIDSYEALVYMATSGANLTLVQERWPEITFSAIRELQQQE